MVTSKSSQLKDRRSLPAHFDDQRLLSVRDVIQKTTLGRATLYSLVSRGEFPKPISISANRVAWPASAIDKWIADRMAGN